MARPRAWADTLVDVAFTTTGGVLIDNLLTPLTASDTVTAVRLIIHLHMVPQNLSDDIDGGTVVDMAVGVSAAEAFNANVLPDPNVAGDTPARGWLWRDRLIAVGNSVTGPPAHDVYYGTEIRADVRAMRKVDRGILYLHLISGGMTVSGAYLPVAVIGIVRTLCLT